MANSTTPIGIRDIDGQLHQYVDMIVFTECADLGGLRYGWVWRTHPI
jgi:hypothetical protein